MRSTTAMLVGGRSALGLIVALASACSSAPAETSDREVVSPRIEGVDATEAIGHYQGAYDAKTGALSIYSLDAGGLLTKAVDTVAKLPASSSGTPTGGGIVAFSPSGSTTSGCATPSTTVSGNSTICGPIRLVNRFINGTTKNFIVRNTYAVVTSISTGWSVVNSGESTRSHGSAGLPSGSVATYYYEHLLAQDGPNSGATPPSIGFRADRTWTFYGPTGGSFVFNFDVYGAKTTCDIKNSGVEDPATSATVDNDCDGVPGLSRSSTWFVDPTGTDASSATDSLAGSITHPFKTLAYALSQATTTKNTIALATSTGYTVTDGINLTSGGGQNVRALLAGYELANGFASRVSDRTKTVITSTRSTANSDSYGLVRSGVLTTLVLQNFTLFPGNGADGATGKAAGSSIGMYFGRSAVSGDVDVILSDITINPGGTSHGGNGASGVAVAGVAGAAGLASGTSPTSAACLGGDTPGVGGAGGAGGLANKIGGAGSSGGKSGSNTNGGSGGAAEIATACSSGAAGNGSNGSNGSGVVNGAGSTGDYAPDAQFYDGSPAWFSTGAYVVPAEYDGGAGYGKAGGGGGGGGGGYGCSGSVGIAGGSGGGGGCGGVALGGGGGGASFGVWAVKSWVRANGTVLITTKPGNGGNGAANGGSGAAGGTGGDASGHGGTGGTGGTGANASSAQGAGGNSGLSICGLRDSAGKFSSLADANCTHNTGTFGTGSANGIAVAGQNQIHY